DGETEMLRGGLGGGNPRLSVSPRQDGEARAKEVQGRAPLTWALQPHMWGSVPGPRAGNVFDHRIGDRRRGATVADHGGRLVMKAELNAGEVPVATRRLHRFCGRECRQLARRRGVDALHQDRVLERTVGVEAPDGAALVVESLEERG